MTTNDNIRGSVESKPSSPRVKQSDPKASASQPHSEIPGHNLNGLRTSLAINRFSMIPDQELRIKYCGIISTFRGCVLGRDKDQLIDDYLDVITYVLGEKSKENGVSDSDTICILNILRTLMTEKIKKIGADRLLSRIPHHLILGKDAWAMDVDFPQMMNFRVQSQPSSEYQIDLKFKENLVENKRLRYIFEGTGGILVWKIDPMQVQKLYKLSGDYLYPETILNGYPNESSVILEKDSSIKHMSRERVNASNLSYIPEEQRILEDAFSKSKYIYP